ncbi:hypothetical protein [Bacillus subtilis]|uniref:hypothetical protein n=1 Tax=Bacillus subtilis TaxID=1423 RepID=UPI002DB6A42E|nr:hypothetical protein [Bacillus subtilis]MEC2264980.1 hypothetical protein [Bacillus subtilis]
MKKFTKIERNLITVILDGRRNDYKKERDFEKVFGRNASIDLVDGRSYLLDDALFGEKGAPGIIGDLLYEMECGNIRYDVMIDALEAAVNEDWENVPSVEEALNLTARQKDYPQVLKAFLDAYRAIHLSAKEEGVSLGDQLDSTVEEVLKGIGINKDDYEISLLEFPIKAEALNMGVVQSMLRNANWTVRNGDFDFIKRTLSATKALDERASSEGVVIFRFLQDIEALAFYAAGFDGRHHELCDNALTLYYDDEKTIDDTVNEIKKLVNGQ